MKEHFRVLHDIVGAESGAVVKTIGDAVMATFPTPDHAISAALRMRDAMQKLNRSHGGEDLLLKIGIHEGPCLAVMLNDRQDYFGQTVNIASRVQNLAMSHAIFATGAVVEDPATSELMETSRPSCHGATHGPSRHDGRVFGLRDPVIRQQVPFEADFHRVGNVAERALAGMSR